MKWGEEDNGTYKDLEVLKNLAGDGTKNVEMINKQLDPAYLMKELVITTRNHGHITDEDVEYLVNEIASYGEDESPDPKKVFKKYNDLIKVYDQAVNKFLKRKENILSFVN